MSRYTMKAKQASRPSAPKSKQLNGQDRHAYLNELDALAQGMPSFTLSKTLKTAAIFASHFQEQAKVINSGGTPDCEIITLCIRCFPGIVGRDPQKSLNLPDLVLRTWPSAFTCMNSLYDTDLNEQHPRIEKLKLTLISQMIVTYCWSCCGAVSRNPPLAEEVLRFTIKLWIRECSSKHFVLSSCSPEALLRLLGLVYPKASRYSEGYGNGLKTILDVFPKPYRLASFGIMRLRHALDDDLAPAHDFSQHISLLIIFCSTRDSEVGQSIRQSLLNSNAIPLVLRAFGRIVRKLDAASDAIAIDAIGEAANKCITFVLDLLPSAKDITQIVDAFRSGILQHIMRYSPFVDEIGAFNIQTLFTIILPRYLVHESCIFAARCAVDASAADGLLEKVRGSTCKASWEQFESQLVDRLVIKCLYKNQEHHEESACGNPQCNKRGPTHIFKRCAGCKISLYCSKSCQKVDWKTHGHRASCSGCSKGPNPDRFGLEIMDRRLLTVFSSVEVRRHLRRLRADSPQEYEDLLKHELVCDVSYSSVPPAVSIVSAETSADTKTLVELYTKYQDHEPAEDNGCKDPASGLNDSDMHSTQSSRCPTTAILRTNFPCGDSPIIFCFCVHFSNLELDDEVGGPESMGPRNPNCTFCDSDQLRISLTAVDELIRRVQLLCPHSECDGLREPWNYESIRRVAREFEGREVNRDFSTDESFLLSCEVD
ncbi:hypothetical protein DFH11DRAFT_1743753 [Phellopilus nigrolimitatus]|nr:hypothetical protein DFH11DRAFT_1743753 [Phellopilus nigrolimitatus]